MLTPSLAGRIEAAGRSAGTPAGGSTGGRPEGRERRFRAGGSGGAVGVPTQGLSTAFDTGRRGRSGGSGRGGRGVPAGRHRRGRAGRIDCRTSGEADVVGGTNLANPLFLKLYSRSFRYSGAAARTLAGCLGLYPASTVCCWHTRFQGRSQSGRAPGSGSPRKVILRSRAWGSRHGWAGGQVCG